MSDVAEVNDVDQLILTELVQFKFTLEALHIFLKDVTQQQYLPARTVICDELKDVVDTTETATIEIMSSCESILQRMQDTDHDLYHDVETDIIRIYESCVFQDLTGQRLKKASKALMDIDEAATALLQILSKKYDHRMPLKIASALKPDKDGIRQCDIDQYFGRI